MSALKPPSIRLRVIRDRFTIEHTSPFKRQITNEITLLNTSDDTVSNIILFRTHFMPGLEVRDSDGALLPIRPNEDTREILEDIQDRDPFYRRILQDMNNHHVYVVWIDLPVDRQIAGRDARLIYLKYFDDRNPHILSWCRSIFSIPRYELWKNTPPDERYDTHYVIHAPDGFLVSVQRQSCSTKNNSDEIDLKDSDGFHITKTDRLVAMRVPHLPQQEVNLYLKYDVILESPERLFLRALTWLSLGVSLTLLLVAFNLTPITNVLGKDMTLLLQNGLSIAGAGLAAVDAAIITLLTNPLCHRTKAYLSLALMLMVIGLTFSAPGLARGSLI